MNTLKKVYRKFKGKKGTVFVLFTAAVGALAMMTSLSLNVANLHHTSIELQNAADAAALSGVTKIPIVDADARPIVHSVAQEHTAAGHPVTLLDPDIQFGNYNLDSDIFSANTTPINAVRVVARRDGTSPNGPVNFTFGQFLGIDSANLTREAIAVQDNRVVGATLIPYGVYRPVVDTDMDGDFEVGMLVNLYATPNTPPGNFAWVDFDGDQNPTGELRDWLLNGFEGLTIPQWIPGSTGQRGDAPQDEWDQRVGDTVVMPVYYEYQLQGSNGQYYLNDLVAVKILAVDTNGPPNNRHVTAEIVQNGSSGYGVDDDAEENETLFALRLIH